MMTYKNMVSFEIYRIQIRLQALKKMEWSPVSNEQKLREMAAARVQVQMLTHEFTALKELEKTL